jgi:hypothetical protein
LGGEGGVADEAASLLEGLGGFGEEAPEDVEVVGVHAEQLEASLHPAVLGVVGELAGLVQERSPVAAWISIGGRPVRSADSGLITGSSAGCPAR